MAESRRRARATRPDSRGHGFCCCGAEPRSLFGRRPRIIDLEAPIALSTACNSRRRSTLPIYCQALHYLLFTKACYTQYRHRHTRHTLSATMVSTAPVVPAHVAHHLTHRSHPPKLVFPRGGRCAAPTPRTCHTTSTPRQKTRDGNRQPERTRTSSRRSWPPTTAPRALHPQLVRRPKARSDAPISSSNIATAGVRPVGGSPRSPAPSRTRGR
jgi:hypothetical protein